MVEIDLSDEVVAALRRIPDLERAISDRLNRAWAEGVQLRDTAAALGVLVVAWDEVQADMITARAKEPKAIPFFISLKDHYKERFQAGAWPQPLAVCAG